MRPRRWLPVVLAACLAREYGGDRFAQGLAALSVLAAPQYLGLTGFSDEELAGLLAQSSEGLTDPDTVPDVPLVPVSVSGDVWVMGDHRSVSKDSRLNPQAPFVPVSNVVGKAFVVVWPLGHAGGVAGPGETFARVPEKD